MNTCAGRHHLLFWLALVACSAGAVQSTKLYIYPLDKNLTDCKPGWSTHSYGAELAIPQASLYVQKAIHHTATDMLTAAAPAVD